MARAEPSSEHESKGSLGIDNFPCLDHSERARQKRRLKIQKLIRLVFSLTGDQTGCHEEVDFFVGEPRRRIERQEVFEILRRAAGLLLQLASGAIHWSLAAIESSRGNLIEIPIRRVPVLAYEKHLEVGSRRITEKGHHSTRPRMPNHLELARRAIRKLHRVDIERDDLAGIDPS